MSSCTDPLRFNEKSLFQELKKSLTGTNKETWNIITVEDDMLYAWDSNKCCVLVMNVVVARSKYNEDIPYQTLLPTDSPVFEVTTLLLNETITQLVLWGNLGILLMVLPKRWGKGGVFQGGKPEIMCVSHTIAGIEAMSEIRRVRWHPASTNDSQLLVLTSDNSFGLYDCSATDKAPTIIKRWRVGRAPMGSPSKIPDFSNLGETAVDFDFATPTLQKPGNYSNRNINQIKKLDWRQIEWPILVLCGNGEVLMVRDEIYNNYVYPTVMGPLSMYPPAIDNYGIDSCSILCIQTTPPIIVIATCTGKIYHSILLRESNLGNEDLCDDDERKTLSHYSSTYSLNTPEEALYVYECIEMELGLLYTDTDKKYTCPIHLHHDKGNKSRYFCSHNAGVHMVGLPMVSQLEKFVAAVEDSVNDDHLPQLTNQSNSQYLICTRTKHTDSEQLTPILGLGFLQEPCTLIGVLHNGDIVDIPIVDFYYMQRLQLPEPMKNPATDISKVDFYTHIKNLLKHENSQPITKLGIQSKMSLQESLQLLNHSTHIFRSEYFFRIHKVREEINKKVRTLKIKKAHLLKEIESLLNTRMELKNAADTLYNRFKDIKTKQDDLERRSEEVVKKVNYKEPSMTAIEKMEAKELIQINSKTKDLRFRIDQLQERLSKQSVHLKDYKNSKKQNKIVLSSTQEKVYKDNLFKMSTDIKFLISEFKKLKDEVEIRM
ncbi:nuclear pore complex protein Nup88 [Prorops nasuta]|uniref:nuclear pore complex protein Nup88 n=1 Tax=Prorops nasuta TaxID=863751 RepID=UPI0034CFAA6C